MSIKVKMRGNDKATVRFNNQMEQQYFVYIMRQHRDDKQPHPDISIKSVRKKEYPRLPKKMLMPTKPVNLPDMPVPGQPVVQNFKPNIVQQPPTQMAAKGAEVGMKTGLKHNKKEK